MAYTWNRGFAGAPSRIASQWNPAYRFVGISRRPPVWGFAGYRRGFGDALNCSGPDPGPPPDPQYENCDPRDSTCVARNTQLNAQHNVDVQAYHDAQAACSAQKWAASGGTIVPGALTYGAGMDLTTGQVYTAPVASQAAYIAAGQPYQTPAQLAASEAAISAVQNQPLMWTGGAPGQPAPPPAKPTPAVPAQPAPTGIVTVSSGVPPAVAKPPAAAGAPTAGAAPSSSSAAPTSGFSLSNVPTWGWIAGAGVVALMAMSRQGR